MDTAFYQQYGEEICCYCLRTARQKKRMQYKDFDKQLIQLHKQEKKLYEQIRNLGWQSLVPPVQKGWVRSFEVRDDVKKSKYADFFSEILKKINTNAYSWRKDFKKKKRKRGRKIYVVQPQFLLRLYEHQFIKKNFSDTEKQFFREVWELDWKKQPIKRYEFTEPWRFVLKVRPNMIDKVKIKDALLESKLKEIENYLQRNDYRKRQNKLLQGYQQYKNRGKLEKYNEAYDFKNKSLPQVLDKIKLSSDEHR